MGKPIRSDAVYHGQNIDLDGDSFVRCARCGFPCKTDRDISASEGSRVGWGITNTSYDGCSTLYDDATVNYEQGSEGYDTTITYDKADVSYDTGADTTSHLGYDGIDKTIYDPIQTSGCPQCGTLLY